LDCEPNSGITIRDYFDAMRTAYPIRFKHRRTAVASWAVCLLLLFAGRVNAGADNAVQVSDARVRETVPGQSIGAAYMRIRSTQRVELVRVQSGVARSAEIHQMSMENGLMRMRELKSVGIDAGREVALEPGGTHIMLVDMKRPLRPGEEVTLKLHFRRLDGSAFAMTVRAPVKSLAAEAAHEH